MFSRDTITDKLIANKFNNVNLLVRCINYQVGLVYVNSVVGKRTFINQTKEYEAN